MNEVRTIRDFESKDSYIGYLEAKIRAYEEIIAKSNFKSILPNYTPAPKFKDDYKKPYKKPYSKPYQPTKSTNYGDDNHE